MKLLRALKYRSLRWLAEELRQVAGGAVRPACRLGAGSQLSHEASVENLVGDDDRIRVGDHSYVRGRLLTYAHGGEISIGDWCYVGVRSEIWSMERISIGNNVLIAHNVNIHDGTAHSRDAVERRQHFRDIIERGHPRTWDGMPGVRAAPVTIGDDVWISFGATILHGVTIGAGSIIAAGALVTQDVPPNSIYRSRVTPEIIPL